MTFEDKINKILVEDRNPKIGIFWVLNHEKDPEIVSFTQDLRETKTVGGFKDGEADHWSSWPKLKLRGEYTSIPRGRVIFSVAEKIFRIFLPSYLHDDRKIVGKICREFSLPLSKIVLVTDPHYEREEDVDFGDYEDDDYNNLDY